eukprot:jgi/Chlat1/7247/Chrsp58S06892
MDNDDAQGGITSDRLRRTVDLQQQQERSALDGLGDGEHEGDSEGVKFEGALLNALVFVVAITVMTFVLFLLFKYRCTKCIWGYMGFSGFIILGFIGGGLALQVIEVLAIPLDIVTFTVVLYNFAVVGVLAVFFWPAPAVVKQAYLVAIGAIVAFWFTRLPEWTTWLLLAAMAVYDLFAVLVPGGPLKVLVELATERDEDIPALVYEARPGNRIRAGRPAVPIITLATMAQPTPSGEQSDAAHGGTNSRSSRLHAPPPLRRFDELHRGVVLHPIASEANGTNTNEVGGDGAEEESSHPLIDRASSSSRAPHPHMHESGSPRSEDGSEYSLPDSIKLGLGDFIFYSVLVGRAAMYDMMTVYVCYLGIIAGLGATLFLLSVYHKALPALPISIALGIVLYFLTRFVMEPFVVGLATSLLFV